MTNQYVPCEIIIPHAKIWIPRPTQRIGPQNQMEYRVTVQSPCFDPIFLSSLLIVTHLLYPYYSPSFFLLLSLQYPYANEPLSIILATNLINNHRFM